MSTVINKNIPHPYDEMGYYEEKYNLKETHDQMLSVLLFFDKFCRKNNIKYSLADGTLLGALRHGDFIPWDDDADVMVTRQEYKKIRKALSKKCGIRLFKAHFLDRITAPGFDKKKVYLDLFINEDMPANSIVFGWKKFETRFLRTSFNNTKVRNVRHDKMSKGKKKARDFVGSIIGIAAKVIIGNRDVFELNDKAVAIGKHQPSGIYTRYTSRMYETKRRFNKASYNAGYADVDFRGHRLMALKNSDTFLKEMYGDYSVLLPEDKRKPEHPVNMMNSPKSCIKWYN